MKVSIQLELTSGTSYMARAAAFTTKSLTESLYMPPALWLRLLLTLSKGKRRDSVGGREMRIGVEKGVEGGRRHEGLTGTERERGGGGNRVSTSLSRILFR